MADVRGFFHRTDDGGARHRARSQLWNPELGADVVEAARTYFEPYVHGLFEDPRASVVAEDGRNYLLGTSERFDVIVADLFMPWKAGVGSLYSLEHYEVARDRLKDSMCSGFHSTKCPRRSSGWSPARCVKFLRW